MAYLIENRPMNSLFFVIFFYSSFFKIHICISLLLKFISTSETCIYNASPNTLEKWYFPCKAPENTWHFLPFTIFIKDRYCRQICAGFAQFQLSAFIKSVCAVLWIMDFFFNLRSFSRSRSFVNLFWSITIAMANVLTNYIFYFRQYKPAHLRPAKPRTLSRFSLILLIFHLQEETLLSQLRPQNWCMEYPRNDDSAITLNLNSSNLGSVVI